MQAKDASALTIKPNADYVGSATYSPEDNKLRLYPFARLPHDVYSRLKSAGFSWAPRQELFVAPMWTPARADLLSELCGEIDDEDTTLVERAEDRADRFTGYRARRIEDANRARAAVDRIADNIPFGQPILIGHHSERRARKDAERIQNGMRKAVNMWDTADYWRARAAGALGHAKYKERPDVRARRIKTIEADKRKLLRTLERHRLLLALWSKPGLSRESATAIAGRAEHGYFSSSMLRTSGYTGPASYYDVLTEPEKFVEPPTFEQIVSAAIRAHTVSPGCSALRWLAHYDNRLEYERAMLDESGYIEPPKRATKAVLPLLNYPGAVEYRNPYCRGEIVKAETHAMTKDELARISPDYKATRISADGSHRIRVALLRLPGATSQSLVAVFLTDSKQHPKPGAGPIEGDEAEKAAARVERARETLQQRNEARAKIAAHNKAVIQAAVNGEAAPVLAEAVPPTDDDLARAETARLRAMNETREAVKAQAAPFEELRHALQSGVQVVSAPQLFPTPADVAARMVELADIKPGMRVLEPSAGTGRILEQLPEGCDAVAVEINAALGGRLNADRRAVVIGDFLRCTSETLWGSFDRILMNPPFANADDIKHIRHALQFLKPGGVLVAICAGGPRQASQLQPLADLWEPLPDGTFAEQGANVRTVLLTIRKPAE